MDYWAETMQDDCYLIADDGWCGRAAPAHRRGQKQEKQSKPGIWHSTAKRKFQAELIPPGSSSPATLPTNRRPSRSWKPELAAIATADGGNGGGTRRRGRTAAEDEGENDKGKITQRPVSTHGSRKSTNDADVADERKVLEDYSALLEKQADAKVVESSTGRADDKMAAKYGKLTEDEIKTLVVEDKWLATLAAAVQGELDRVSQTLTGRIRQLAERYATPCRSSPAKWQRSPPAWTNT